MAFNLAVLFLVGCCSIPAADGMRVKARAMNVAEPEPLDVTIFWMRHGFSCANVLNFPWENVTTKINFLDPPLTDCGVARAGQFGPPILAKIKKVVKANGLELLPEIFTSPLIRAQETALYNFQESDIRPIAYIAEEGSGKENTPKSSKDQWDTWFEDLPSLIKNRIKYDDEINPADHKARSSGDKSSYSRFLIKFPWALVQLMQKHGITSTKIAVIVVGHSNYMREHLKMCTEQTGAKPRNNEVWVQTYKIEHPPDPDDAQLWTYRQSTSLRAAMEKRNSLRSIEREKQRHKMTDKSGKWRGECSPLYPYHNSVSPFPGDPLLTCEEVVQRCPMKPAKVERESAVCRAMSYKIPPKVRKAFLGETQFLVCGTGHVLADSFPFLAE